MRYWIDVYELLVYNLLQIKFSLKISWGIGFLAAGVMSLSEVINVWLSANIDYVRIALAIVAVDHVLGSIVHFYYKKDFHIKKNIIGLLIKLLIVAFSGLIFEGLAYITNEQDMIYMWLKMTLRLLVCIYPGKSALENMRIITKGKFPPAALIGKINAFEKELDIKKLKDKGDE